MSSPPFGRPNMWQRVLMCGERVLRVEHGANWFQWAQGSIVSIYSRLTRFSVEGICIYHSKYPQKRSHQCILGHSEGYIAWMVMPLCIVYIGAIWSILHLLTVSLWVRDTPVQHVCTVEHFRLHFIAHRCLSAQMDTHLGMYWVYECQTSYMGVFWVKESEFNVTFLIE